MFAPKAHPLEDCTRIRLLRWNGKKIICMRGDHSRLDPIPGFSSSQIFEYSGKHNFPPQLLACDHCEYSKCYLFAIFGTAPFELYYET